MFTQTTPQAPLRKVVSRVPVPDHPALAHDRLACGHSVVVLRHSRPLPYWHCYACHPPVVVDITERELLGGENDNVFLPDDDVDDDKTPLPGHCAICSAPLDRLELSASAHERQLR